MAATIAAAAITLGYGIYKGIKANKEKKKAQQAMKDNIRPEAPIPQYEYDNQRLLESRMSEGLPEQSRRVAEQAYERGLASTINAINRSGGSVNDVTRAYRTYNDSVDQLTLMDANYRVQNLNNYLYQNRRMSSNEINKWQIDEMAPYMDRAALYRQMYGIAQQNQDNAEALMVQGVTTGLSGAMRYSDMNAAKGGSGFLNMRMGKGNTETQSAIQGNAGSMSDNRYMGTKQTFGKTEPFTMYSPQQNGVVSARS